MNWNSCVEVKLTEEGLNVYKAFINSKLIGLNSREKMHMQYYYNSNIKNNSLEICLSNLIQIFGWSLYENKQPFEYIKIDGQDISLEELSVIISGLKEEQRARS